MSTFPARGSRLLAWPVGHTGPVRACGACGACGAWGVTVVSDGAGMLLVSRLMNPLHLTFPFQMEAYFHSILDSTQFKDLKATRDQITRSVMQCRCTALEISCSADATRISRPLSRD